MGRIKRWWRKRKILAKMRELDASIARDDAAINDSKQRGYSYHARALSFFRYNRQEYLNRLGRELEELEKEK